MRGKGFLGAVGAAIVAAILAAPAQAIETVPDQVIVQFAKGAGAGERADALADTDTRALEGLGAPGLKLVKVEGEASVAETIQSLEDDPDVLSADPNGIEQPSAIPNDPLAPSLWAHLNAGQTVNGVAGAVDADMDTNEAWDIETGNANTVIAIMDTGADITHPDLAPNLWQNPGEAGGNGVDDDGNGFVDDVNGFDFVGSGAGDANPLDDVGHGTHVAGIAAAAGNDGFGVSGVSQRASIMVLKACNVNGCIQADQIQAINYAAANGAHILNGSLGGFSGSENAARRAAIFSHPNVLHVFAAGNDAANSDNTPAECNPVADPCRAFPCAHAPVAGEVDNTLCVAATTQTDAKASFSNIGVTSVDLAAPGVNIQSSMAAERTHFTETFAANDYTTRWDPNPGDDLDWTRTSEPPLNPNFGITDSPGGNYAANTDYGAITAPIAVPAVSERGCEVRLRRSIALAGTADSFRVALLHNGAVAGTEAVRTSASNSAMANETLEFVTPPGAGNLQVRVRLVSANDATQADGVHIDSVTIVCGESPGPGGHGFKQGTSMASPEVAGAAGLVFSRNASLSAADVRALIVQGVDPNAAMSGVTTTGGRINIGATIARTPPDTALSGGPGEGEEIGIANPTFTYSSNDPASSFQCAVDGGTFSFCTSGSSEAGPLGPGPHSFSVRAVDSRNNVDATPPTRTFAVEADAPETQIKKSPKRRTGARKAKFTFTSDEPGSSFECRIDKKRFSPCRSPRKYKRLDSKRHKFQVRAVDQVGNVDPTPSRKSWKVKR